ncbi:hypothetical protein RclHR1_20430004 [Rhizophagus clarus]|uniref:Crinkler effector protein N-terminal domain-containing protein n=1 Tax=Rhizophagus clarus TaxID=94130 RepID=A0A2Z6QRE6_9GLOM|nr:hypothetical protein RclHR1_20430004 [Rhizophagus clarus]GES98269.1 hypothetical protein GLOIN_2v583658 [Rhizophagus clarus]
MYSERNIIKMKTSFNCCILRGNTSDIEIFPFPILKEKDEIYVEIKGQRIALDQVTVGYLREFICSDVDDFVKRKLKLWKINVKKSAIKNNVSTENDIKQKLHGKEMEPEELFKDYFEDELNNQKFILSNIHVIAIIPTTGPSQQGIPLGPNWNDPSSIYGWIQQFSLNRNRIRLVRGFGEDLKFCGRDDTINTLWYGDSSRNGIVGRFKDRNKSDKSLHPIPVLAGGPGTGKSRFLDEIEGLLRRSADDSGKEDIRRAFSNLVVINITYGNGSPADPLDIIVGQTISNKAMKNAQASLAIRILFEYFQPQPRFGKFDYSSFRSLCNGISLSTVLRVIYYDIIKQKNLEMTSNPLLVLVLGVDEINKLYELDKDSFKILINAIGGIMCNSPENIFFIPILAGTIEGPLEQYITGSMHQPLPLPLRLLDGRDAIGIGKAMNWFDDKYVSLHPYFRIGIDDIGGHVKTLEYFYRKFSEDLVQCEGDPYQVKVEEVMMVVKCAIDYKYRLSFNSRWLDVPLIKAILDLPVDKYEKIKFGDNGEISYQDLSSMGILNIEEKTTGCYIRLPYLWASVLVKRSKHSGMTYWRSMFDYDDPIYWQNFEDFNAKFWALRLSLFRLLGYKKIKLRELLKGAKFSRGFPEEAEIILPEDIKLCKLRHRYPATEANENKNMNEMEESFRCYTKLDCLKNEDIKNEKYMNFVFLNAPGAPWDVFSFLNYESSETGIFCVAQQIKYTNVETLETRTIDQDSFNDEYEKDVPVDDWALLFLTIAESKESLNIKCKNNSALVSRKQFQDFYGFTYASRAQFASANEKIFINSAPPETLKILGFTNHQCHNISLKRLKRPFSSLDDVKAELDLSENQFKKLKYDNRITF